METGTGTTLKGELGAASSGSVVLVAGGTGFIGSHVVELLTQKGHEVVLLLRRGGRSSASVRTVNRTREIVLSSLSSLEPHAMQRELEPYVEQYRGRLAALVNLVGIKLERDAKDRRGPVTFREAHVEVTRTLLRVSEFLQVPHLVHVSVLCARRDDAFSTESYHHTKWESEQLIHHHQQSAASGAFSYTIVRPSVVFGNGDDMITNLVRSLKHLPAFPLPGDGMSIHQPVHVTDVARAVERGLVEGPSRLRNSILEIVGPEKMTLRRMIETVARGIALPSPLLIPTPLAIERVAAEVMVRTFEDPLITPTQLRMLSEGMASQLDCDPIVQVSTHSPGLSGSASSSSLNGEEIGSSSDRKTNDSREMTNKVRLTPELVKSIEPSVGPFMGISLRLLTDDRHYDWMEGFGNAKPSRRSNLAGMEPAPSSVSSSLPLTAFALVTFLAMIVLTGTTAFGSFFGPEEEKAGASIWWRLFAVNLVVIPVCIWVLNRIEGVDWRTLLQPTMQHTIAAVVFALVGYAFSFASLKSAEMFLPNAQEMIKEMTEIRQTRDLVGPGLGFTLLSMILIPGDEILWRGTILLPLCALLNGASGKPRDTAESPSSKSRRRDLGLVACFISSLFWALAHKLFFDTWIVGLAAFSMGLLWSGFLLRTRSLYAVILTHLLWDTLTVYILPLV